MDLLSIANPSVWLASASLGALGGLFDGAPNSPEITPYDPTADLAKLNALYTEAGQGVKASVEAGTHGMTQRTAGNLAARGIYSSPVSEYAFQQDRAAKIQALTQAQNALAQQKAQAMAGLIGQGVDYNQRIAIANQQAQYQNEMRDYQTKQQLLAALIGGGAALAGGNYGK